MFSSDQIVSFTLSVALHLLAMLLIGHHVLLERVRQPDTVPELELASVELALTEAGPDAPGAEQTAAPSSAELPPLQLPDPVAPTPPPEVPDKTELAELLPPPPEPEPVAQPAPAPVTPPPPAPQPPAPVQPPAPPQQPAAAAPAAPAAQTQPAAAPGTLEKGGGSAGHIDAHPALERPIRPTYPIGSRRRGEEGTVILDVTVTTAGDVSSVTLVASSGFPDLDRAAQRAAAQARFKPGTRDGKPAPASARLTLIFRLRDA